MAEFDSGTFGFEPAVISVARRERVKVRRALEKTTSMTGEALARALVEIVVDANRNTITAVLEAISRVEDDFLRARTVFSVLGQASTKLLKNLPKTAQDTVIRLVQEIGNPGAGAVALRNMPETLPAELTRRLIAVAESIANPLQRLIAILHFENHPDESRQAALIAMAEGIPDERDRGEVLGEIAPLLGSAELERVYGAAKAITDPDVAGRALVRIAYHFSEEHRQSAHSEILELSVSIREPIRRFDVVAALDDLPTGKSPDVESLLFDLATAFDDAGTRCRAMFIAAGFAQDPARRDRALLAGIAAAEGVTDEHQRGELLLLLRPGAPSLPPSIRRELTRAVDRLKQADVKQELYETLSRFFVYERPDASEGTRGPVVPSEEYDLFVSYSTMDQESARFLATELKSRGLRVFLSADAIDAAVGTSSWTKALDRALVNSRALLVMITQNSHESRWVAEEWGKYYQHMVETGMGRMLSLRLSGPARAELPLTLRAFQIIESESGQIERDHLTRIMDIIRGR